MNDRFLRFSVFVRKTTQAHLSPESAVLLVEHFSELEDPRRYNRRHYLRDILVIAICAAISGANGWNDVAQFGKLKMAWLKGTLCLELPHGVPSAETFLSR